MKLRSIIPIVTVGVVALSAAVIGARPASAAIQGNLCIGTVCAFPNGAGSPVGMAVGQNFNWNSPGWGGWLFNGLDHTGQIQQATSSLCMQLDHAAGNLVIEATCNGASYQKWTAFLAPDGYDWMFYSMWDMSQCLTYNADHSRLDTVGCNGAWYQQFAPDGG
jgi:hypothetical protein